MAVVLSCVAARRSPLLVHLRSRSSRPPPFKLQNITCMTQYKSDFGLPVAFEPQSMDNVLAEWLSKHDLPQVHVAETEKYAHVTFFFNGGTEAQFEGEVRDLIP